MYLLILIIIILIYCYFYKKEHFKKIDTIDFIEIGTPKEVNNLHEMDGRNRLIISDNPDYLDTQNYKNIKIKVNQKLHTVKFDELIKKYKIKTVNNLFLHNSDICKQFLDDMIEFCNKPKNNKYFPGRLHIATANKEISENLELNGYYCKNLNKLKNTSLYYKYNFYKKNKVSIIILVYDRNHNLKKSIPYLNKIPIIDEIIIANGKDSLDLIDNNIYKKVINLNDIENNSKYYTLRRFYLGQYAKNDIIIMLDDDVIPSKELIYNMISHYNVDNNNIYGPVKRCCYNDGYYCNRNDCLQLFHKCKLFDNYNLILTGLTLIPKKIMNNVSKNFKKHKKYFKNVVDNKGNGEDILFNYVFRTIYKKKPVYVEGSWKNLDFSNGYSTGSQIGFNIRSNLCKKLNFNKFKN